MKHQLSVLATLACLQAFSAITYAEDSLTLFGNFRGSFNSVEDAGKDLDGISFQNNASILGLKGSLSKDDVTSYVKYIMRSHNDGIFGGGATSTIIYTAGIKGAFGDISYGVGSTPYKVTGMKLDPFWDTSASARGFDGPSIGLSNLSWGFTKNMLQWNSDKLFDNVKLDATIVVDDSNEDKHDYNIGATYSKDAYSFGVQYINLDAAGATAKSPGEGNATRLWGKYKQEGWDVAVSMERVSLDLFDDQDHILVASNIYLSKKLKLALAYGDSNSNVASETVIDGFGGSVGLFYNILPKTQIYTVINRVDRNQMDDRQVYAIGVIHNFGAKLK